MANRSSKAFCPLVWAMAILLPLMVLAAVMIPWSTQNSNLNQRIAHSEDQLARYRRMVRTLPTLKAELQQVRNNDALKAFYFNAPTQALAGAQLQSQVQEIVTAAKGRLVSTQLLPEQKNEDPPRVSVRTQIKGSTEALLDVLYQLEQARPFLFVERLSIRSSARPASPNRNVRGRPVRRLRGNPSGELTVRLDIFGFALGGGA